MTQQLATTHIPRTRPLGCTLNAVIISHMEAPHYVHRNTPLEIDMCYQGTIFFVSIDSPHSITSAESSAGSLAVVAPNQLGLFGYTSAPTNPTNDMAFLGKRMEEFLAPPDADFDLLGPSLTDSVYSWPNLSLWTA
ncbi:hypothetical protein PCH_Pc21g13170 [Penicillium rubens Wisconsin 54-1255]|uniref:Uncharacterized protein n=1 Tax=Penicillium rubens (strain ATCC 28089 / DSM 1075 / NRRL 1951 / Wisconsin 54-1255) TaxID=500485 RepID=B6HMG5_PENRW|nr:hypothetical protein PCH_Pc21g13170 [Penicillium rubens Wisconsin 54-1255]